MSSPYGPRGGISEVDPVHAVVVNSVVARRVLLVRDDARAARIRGKVGEGVRVVELRHRNPPGDLSAVSCTGWILREEAPRRSRKSRLIPPKPLDATWRIWGATNPPRLFWLLDVAERTKRLLDISGQLAVGTDRGRGRCSCQDSVELRRELGAYPLVLLRGRKSSDLR